MTGLGARALARPPAAGERICLAAGRVSHVHEYVIMTLIRWSVCVWSAPKHCVEHMSARPPVTHSSRVAVAPHTSTSRKHLAHLPLA